MSKYGNRVKERITATAGTGTFQLEGIVPTTFRAFGSEFVNADAKIPYIAVHEDNTWEIGEGTYVSATDDLQRDTVLQNSLGTTAKINFASGNAEIFSDVTADSLAAFSHLRDIIDATAAGVQVITIDSTERILFGATVPVLVGSEAGSVTVSTGPSGALKSTLADELLVENNSSGGITIAGPNTTIGSIYWADPQDADVARIRYDHNTDNMSIWVNAALALTIDASQRILTGTTVPDAVGASSGSVTISTGNSGVTAPSLGADDLVIEGSGGAGITIATPNSAVGSIMFADPEGSTQGQINYSHATSEMAFKTDATLALTIDGNSKILTGTTVPDLVGASEGSMTISTGDSGVTSVHATADDLIIENNVHAGITIATPNTQTGRIVWTDPEDTDAATISFAHDTDMLSFFIGPSRCAAFDSSRRFLTGSVIPDAVGAEAGSVTISTGSSGVNSPDDAADDLIIENNSSGGISIANPNTSAGNILFADPQDSNVGGINYSHITDAMSFTVDAALTLTLDASNRLLTGTSVPDAVGNEGGSVTISTGSSGVTATNVNADELIIENNQNAGITIATQNTDNGAIYFADPDDDNVGSIDYDHNIDSLSFTVDASLTLTLDAANRLLTGTSVPDLVGATSSMTISTGDSGVTTADGSVDDLIIEGSTNAGITIATPNTGVGELAFGDPQDNNVGRIRYTHNDNTLGFFTSAILALTIDSSRRLLTGTTVPDLVGASEGSMTISTGDSGVTTADTTADDLIIENNTSAGISILTPSTASGSIMFGDPEDPNTGKIVYDHNGRRMTFTSDGAISLTLDAVNRLLTGIIVPDVFGAEAGSMTISTGDSGVTAPNTGADELIIENNSSGGITIAGPNNSIGSILFADPQDNNVGRIAYSHADNDMTFHVNDKISLTMDSNNRLLSGTIVPDVVGAGAGSVTISIGDSGVVTADTTADELIIENDASAGISILTPNTGSGSVVFGDPEDPNIGKIVYNHSDNGMTFTAGTQDELNLTTAGMQLSTGSRVDRILDEDNMASDSATALATQQSIKAYPIGQQTIWLPKSAWKSRPTDGADAGSFETGTNKHIVATFDFDTAVDQFIQTKILMPKGWNGGTIIAQAVWSHPTAATNFGVAWFLQAVALADGDPLDTAFGTPIGMVDTGGTTDQNFITPESAAITVAGTPGAEELVVFQLFRDVSDGGDTLAADARLEGIKIHYTTDTPTDD